ncbi:hypothetical protein ACVIW0_000413 [Bradyrhizobium sp. USDA 4454]
MRGRHREQGKQLDLYPLTRIAFCFAACDPTSPRKRGEVRSDPGAGKDFDSHSASRQATAHSLIWRPDITPAIHPAAFSHSCPGVSPQACLPRLT